MRITYSYSCIVIGLLTFQKWLDFLVVDDINLEELLRIFTIGNKMALDCDKKMKST